MILGVDDMDLFKGISLKFLALGKLLEVDESLRGRVVLVQILNAARRKGEKQRENEGEKLLNSFGLSEERENVACVLIGFLFSFFFFFF